MISRKTNNLPHGIARRQCVHSRVDVLQIDRVSVQCVDRQHSPLIHGDKPRKNAAPEHTIP